VTFQNDKENTLLSTDEVFEMNHLSSGKINILKTHLVTITGRHESYYLRIYKSVKILNGNLSVGHILLDSGATHASYISKELVDKHLDVWKDNITWMNRSVTLDDTKTVKPVFGVITL
jgi:tRNA G37 N-methylase TrmD